MALVRQEWLEKVEKTESCWIWHGSRSTPGYGITKINGKIAYMHRIFYEAFIGPIPNGLVIDHLCRVPSCVNPRHLEPVTTRTNTLRGIGPSAKNAKRTHCIRGHELNADNTYWSKGKRQCKTCHLMLMKRQLPGRVASGYWKEYYKRKKAKLDALRGGG